jgi:inactivated superfamily I helicase
MSCMSSPARSDIKIVLRRPEDAENLWGILRTWKDQKDAGAPLEATIKPYEPTRNLDQNRLLWRILTAFSQQLEWPINGVMQGISKEDWKVVLSASFRAEMARLTQTTDGRIVMLGVSTSRMRKREFAEFIEFLMAIAAERGVELDEIEEREEEE